MYAPQSLSVIQVVRKNIDRNQIIIEAVNLPKTQVLEKQGKHSNEDLNQSDGGQQQYIYFSQIRAWNASLPLHTFKNKNLLPYHTKTDFSNNRIHIDIEIIDEQGAINNLQTRQRHSPNHKMTSYEACFSPHSVRYIPTYFRLNRLLFSNYSVHKKVRNDANASSALFLQLKKPCIHIFLQNMCIWS